VTLLIKKYSLTLMLIVSGLFAATACAQTNRPPEIKSLTAGEQGTREVKGRELTSTARPAVRIKFGGDFKYVGTQKFILYNVAHAEQHFFVDADREGNIRRFYWVQFEGYLPDNRHTYKYEMKETHNLGGFSFGTDARAAKIPAGAQPPDSDGGRARTFLESKGYRMKSDEILMRRFVHLLDESKRDELLIIYIEDLKGTGLTAADLSEKGSAAAKWDEVSKGLLKRALEGMKISRR
jgi:hypothetical protein